jgi:hypothetical protein
MRWLLVAAGNLLATTSGDLVYLGGCCLNLGLPTRVTVQIALVLMT